jgi:hypothetical protein
MQYIHVGDAGTNATSAVPNWTYITTSSVKTA